MKQEDFNKLQPGDVITHVHRGDGYVVHSIEISNGMLHATVIRQITADNASEWDLFSKSKRVRGRS